VRYCPACHSVFPNEFRTCPKDQAELRSASELQPGMVLRGKYEILDKVGAGGMASVYRARHLAFDEVCAIKVVAGRLSDDEDFLRRFRNEAVVARRFQHPHAVRVDDLDTTEDGRPFIVMEYVEGPNLREVVRREGALGLRRALTIARQVASALAAAHQLGIIHRDIKPDNVLLTGSRGAESAKVLDFGIAKVKEGFFGGGDHVATRTGAVVGTPQYISPEQALGRRGDELDGRADLYSLGVVLYEMVTGRLPFESDTAMGIILHHLQTLPTPPHELRPDLDIPEPLSAVLLRMLDKDRDRRFRSAADLIAALDDVLALPLPEKAGPAPDSSAGGARPVTPRPLPGDIDHHETRVMPRTPPVATSVRTPVPTPTLHLPLPIPGTPLPQNATPPPLPSGVRSRVKAKGRASWWKWVGIALAGYVIFGRPDARPRVKPVEEASSGPAAAVEQDDESSAAENARLKAAVEKVLEDAPRTSDEAIAVHVDDGEVTLTGHVHDREIAQEAGSLARTVTGVTDVANEIELRAPGDHRSSVPRAEAVPAVPPPDGGVPPMPGLPALDSALQMVTRDLPVAQLVRTGQRQLERGRPDAALEAFTAALQLDPGNPEAAAGAADAGRQIAARAERQRPRARPSPPPPSPPDPER
jgi:serine/threonine protein kinase